MSKECLKKIKKADSDIEKRNNRLRIENNKCFKEEEEELMDIIDACDESLPENIKELFELCATFDNFKEDFKHVCLSFYRKFTEEDRNIFIEYNKMRLKFWEPFKKRDSVKEFHQICSNYLNYFDNDKPTL